MPEALEEEKTEARTEPAAVGNDGRAGAPGAGSAGGTAVAACPTVLTPVDLRQIGRTLNGEHWQADIAALIGVSRSQVTRYLNGEREMNTLLARHLQYVVIERIGQLTSVLNTPGMPYAGTPHLRKVMETIMDATATLPGQEPPRTR